MYESLGNLPEIFNVVDLYVVPDYESIFKDCIDPHLSKYDMNEWNVFTFVWMKLTIAFVHNGII